MTREELHAHDVESEALQVVQALGECLVVAPDPDTVGRWQTVARYGTLNEAETFMAGWRIRHNS